MKHWRQVEINRWKKPQRAGGGFKPAPEAQPGPDDRLKGAASSPARGGKGFKSGRALEAMYEENRRQKELLALVFEKSPGGLAVVVCEDQAGTQPDGTQPAGTQPGGKAKAGTHPGGKEPGGKAATGRAPDGKKPGAKEPGGEELVFAFANPAYRAITPHPELDPVGRRLSEIWPQDEDQESYITKGRVVLRQVLESGQPQRVMRYKRVLADGQTHYYTYQVEPLRWNNGTAALVVLWETTELVEAQKRAEQSARMAQQHAVELDMLINALPEPVALYDEQGEPVLYNPAAFEALGFLPGAISRDEFTHQPPMRDPDGSPLKEEERPTSQALRGQVVRGQPVSFTNRQGRQVTMLASASPVVVDGQLMGAVSVWQDVTEADRRRRETEALASAAAALRSAVSAEDLYPLILDQINQFSCVDGALIGIAEPSSGELVYPVGKGGWANQSGERASASVGIAGLVISSGQPYVNNDIRSDPRLERPVLFRDLPYGACVPLNTHSQTIGVIWLGSRQPLTSEELNLITAVADMAATAIYRAALFEQTQQRVQRLAGLRAIDIAITSSLDLRTTLNVLLDQVTTQLSAAAADVLQFDDDLQSLKLVAERGLTAQNDRQRGFWDLYARQATFQREPVMITDLREKAPGLAAAAAGEEEPYLAYCAVPLVAKGRVKGVLEVFLRERLRPDKEWVDYMHALATQGAIAMDNAELFQRLQRSRDELLLSYDATIRGWSHALELRDRETAGHSERVTELTLRLARRMGVPDSEIGHYRRGVLLHDIGKMGIPDEILQKTQPLSEEEWEIMRRHPVYAYELLSSIPYLRPALDIPYNHHEKWDGSGYPRGIRGEEIPLSARLFAVVDVWDALRSDRPYRPALSREEVLGYLASQSEIHFDPRVVEAFLSMVREEGEGKR